MMERSEKNERVPPQRRMSFNYKWDVQQQSASVSFSSFGLTFKRPLDLLDESFERSDGSAPVSLIHLSQGQVYARQDLIDAQQRATLGDREKCHHFSIGEFFCPKLTRGQSERRRTEADPLDFPLSSGSYVDSGTVRLTEKRRFDPLLLEDYADQQYWQRQRQFPVRHRPLPNAPSSAVDDQGSNFDATQDRDVDEEYFHSRHLTLVVNIPYPFRPAGPLFFCVVVVAAACVCAIPVA